MALCSPVPTEAALCTRRSGKPELASLAGFLEWVHHDTKERVQVAWGFIKTQTLLFPAGKKKTNIPEYFLKIFLKISRKK